VREADVPAFDPALDQARALLSATRAYETAQAREPSREMRVLETSLPGLLVVEPAVHRDERGFFVETYREGLLADLGITDRWVQDNHSRSTRGVARGLHFQLDGQAKLVRAARGAILDVAVDIRRGSPTFGRHEAIRLDDVDMRMAYLPAGFAHGFCVLSDVADVVYRCSRYYDRDLDRAIALDDPALGIAWPDMDLVLSERDRRAPRLDQVADELPFLFEGGA
jgi:dTDP-4-dehydrorhamnose 3,5-epimerase